MPYWLWCAALAASVCGSGCAASPWNAAPAAANAATGAAVSASPPATTPTPTTAPAPPAAAKEASLPAASQPLAGTAANPSTATNGPAPPARPDPQVIDALVAQIAEQNALDPAAKARLTQDLLQTDPAWWPAMLRVFQASLAYQRQSEEKEKRAAAGVNLVSDLPADSGPAVAAAPNGASSVGLSVSRSASLAHAQGGVRGELTAAQTVPPAPNVLPEPESLPARRQTDAIAPLAMPSAQAEAPRPLAADREASKRETKTTSQKPSLRRPSQEGTGKGEVVAASHTAPAASGADPGPEGLDDAIRLLESEARQSPQSAAELTRQARLRLLYLAAGRREDALRPIQSASPAMQDSWSQMVFGLATWMDTERIPDSANRAAQTRQQLVAAANRLGELAPLAVRNLNLVKEVKGYGDLVPFEKTEFAPGQEVVLYAEVENFKSEETPKGYRTGFHGSYEIFDARGQRVTAKELGNTDEYCRNQRRDFYLNYLFRLPKQIYSGRHTLKLTIEDLHGQKIGQSSLEFTIKASAD